MSITAIMTGMPAKGTTVSRKMCALTQGFAANAIMTPVCIGTAVAAAAHRSAGLMVGGGTFGAVCIKACADYAQELAKLAPEYSKIAHRAEHIQDLKKMG
jgi:hypothetical protein